MQCQPHGLGRLPGYTDTDQTRSHDLRVRFGNELAHELNFILHRFIRVVMSTWNLGIGDVSEETHAFRNKLSSKGDLHIPCSLNVAYKTLDGQIAAQQDRLVRQDADIQELNKALNEALHKV